MRNIGSEAQRATHERFVPAGAQRKMRIATSSFSGSEFIKYVFQTFGPSRINVRSEMAITRPQPRLC
jgi:hypothetical protein